MDNQQLAEILGGHTQLNIGNPIHYMEAMTKTINRMMDDGRKTAAELEDPSVWVPRELNRKADRICNTVMDEKGPSFCTRKDSCDIKGTFQSEDKQ